MAFIPTPAGIEVRMRYKLNESIMENVYHFAAGTNDPDLNELVTIANVCKLWEQNTARNHRNQFCGLFEIVATDISSQTGQQVQLLVDPVILGAVQTASLPSNVSLAVTLRTSQRGRSFRGRTYWIGLGEAMVTNDLVTSAPFIRQDVGQLLADANAAGLPMVVLSKFSGVDADGKPIPRAAGVLSAIISVGGDDVVDSQRRRLFGRGR